MDYQTEDPVRAFSISTSAASTPAAGTGRKTPLSLALSPGVSSSRGVLSGGQPSIGGVDGGGGGGGGGVGSVVTVKVVFAPHQLMHSRTCVDQVRYGSLRPIYM